MLLEVFFNTRNKTNNRKFEIGSLLPFQFEIGSLLKRLLFLIFYIIFITLHLLHITVMPAFSQALDWKTTQLNQKDISVLVLHLILQHLTDVKVPFCSLIKGLP